ncbi:SNX27 [Bugula neritina]|uniref:SNX27 n=1 Tax=Bugula neritina TaxID=10212 RepID=A0A7J7K781_BUGNE|nr:SNX27 [Bugula neritina]
MQEFLYPEMEEENNHSENSKHSDAQAHTKQLLAHAAPDSASTEVEMRIQLPDRSICTVCIPRHGSTQHAYEQLVKKMEISEETAMAFSLFQMLDNNFSESSFFRLSVSIYNIFSLSSLSHTLSSFHVHSICAYAGKD